MAAGTDSLLKKADLQDANLLDDASVFAVFEARREIRKLATRLAIDDGESIEGFLGQCTGAGRRQLALEWLRINPRPEAVGFLSGCLGRPPYLAHLMAASALTSIGNEAARKSLEAAHRDQSDPELRRPIEQALAQFSYPVIPTRVRRAFAEPAARETAIEALGNIASYDATDLLLEGLQDKDKRASEAAFQALAQRDDDRIGPALITLLTEGRAQAKKQAARLLGHRRETLALRALSELCGTAKARDLRMTAAFALGKLGNSAAIPALADRLFDSDEHILVATAACISLGRIGDPEVLALLRRVVDERGHGRGWADLPIQRDIYCAAIDGISRLPLPEVPDILIGYLDSAQEYDRAEAAQCLARLQHVAALPALEQAATAPTGYSDSQERIEKALKRLAKLA